MAQSTEILKERIRRELPALIKTDPSFRDYVLALTRDEYAGKAETEDRFCTMLKEFRLERDEQNKKWEANQRHFDRVHEELRLQRDEQNKKWEANQKALDQFHEQLKLERDEQSKKWEANQRHFDRVHEELRLQRDEQNKKWEANQKALDQFHEQLKLERDEQNKKWEANQKALGQLHEELRLQRDEQNKKWEANQKALGQLHEQLRLQREEQNKKWEANQRHFDRVHEEIMAMTRKHDRAIGALGARWGMQSEASFRNALAGILEKNFGVQVLKINEYDDEGVVFGRPDQVELDVIIKDGLLLICELKSSIDKAGMYIFERKARFYEKRHHRKADRLIIISPMIDAKAQKVAERLGIETYSDSEEVESL